MPTTAARELSAAAAQTPLAPAWLTLALPEVDALVTAAIAQHKLPGCVIAIGRRGGVLFQRAYGDRAIVPARERMTEDTIFDLASLTKAVATTTAAHYLIEHGQLSLDATVGELLPEAGLRARGITLRMLLSHTSGLPAVTPVSEFEPSIAVARANVLRVLPVTSPGARYQYSDIGFIWLGEILERVAREPLDQLVERALIRPLALTQTGYRPIPELRARIAPTELTEHRAQAIIRGVVHDPRAFRLGGVAGNAGLFSDAADLSRVARMLLSHGELDGTRVLAERTVQQLSAPQPAAGVVRTLGWDVRSPHSRNRGKLLSARAFGHGGFTGTALWIDPEQDLFVVFLSNRVHPDGQGDVLDLTAAVTDAAVRGVVRALPCPLPDERVRAGIDVLREHAFAELQGATPRRVGLLTHRAARALDGTTTVELLAQAVDLRAIFTPEHGLDAAVEGVVANGALASASAKRRAIPIYSLFGKTRRPTPAMLRDLDVLVIDLVDVGTRFYTYASTVREALIAASEAHLPVLLLDRPNPIGGTQVEGPMLDPGRRSFVNHHPLPVRHGLTLAELATLIAADLGLQLDLRVVPVAGYQRAMQQADTGLAWHPPSPNLKTADAALLYPAVGLLEGTPLSVGRGTDTPFELIGAPFIDGAALANTLMRATVPGVAFSPIDFTPSVAPFAGQRCRGVKLQITDRKAFSSERTGFALIGALLELYKPQWQRAQLIRLLGHQRTLRALERGQSFDAIHAASAPELAAFEQRRSAVLRYPLCLPGVVGAPVAKTLAANHAP